MVRENTDVTVIGNGDITSGEDVVKMIENTSVDAVMIGRGCLGNPWIFTEANNALAGNIEKIVPTKEELVSVILEHAELLVKLKGEKVGIMEMRNQASWYFKNYYNSKVFRKRSTEIKTLKDLEILCLEYLKS